MDPLPIKFRAYPEILANKHSKKLGTLICSALARTVRPQGWTVRESAFIPFVSFGDLDNNTFKGLTSLLSVEQEIQYDEHT